MFASRHRVSRNRCVCVKRQGREMFHRKPYLDRKDFQSRDIVLCETAYPVACRKATAALTQASISYSKSFRQIPFLKRHKYRGADQMCIISINRNEYTKARRAISNVPENYFERLSINVI